MRDTDVHATGRNARKDTVASDTDPYIEAVLNLWPAEPDPSSDEAPLWRGAAAIAIAGVATIVLLSVVILESGYRAIAALWILVGSPLVLLAAAAVRFSAGRLRPARAPN
jgi:hypothetical protein